MSIYEKCLNEFQLDLSEIPTKLHTGKECFDWMNSVGCKIKSLEYNKALTIIKYDTKKRKLYFDNGTEIRIDQLLKGKVNQFFNPTQVIGVTHPQFIKYFPHKEDAFKYSYGLKIKLPLICPICGTIHEMRIDSLIKNGFSCSNPECQNSRHYKMSGERNPNYGRTGEKHPMYGRTGEKNPMYGRTGEKSGNWQGGITEIHFHLRNLIEPFMNNHKKNLNFTCQITNKKGNLESHHIYPFTNIVRDAHQTNNITIKSTVSDYTKEELEKLENYVMSYHQDYSNMILLSEDIHDEFHSRHGKHYNPDMTYDLAHQQMQEFIRSFE